VAPNIVVFGWGVLLVELALATFLLAGLATRLWAAVGAVQGLAIGLSVAVAPGEWGWSYWLLVAAHVAVAAAPAAGRTAGLDGVVRAVVRPERAGPFGPVARAYLRWLS
jgi:thiosulfate dehydrogenase (quinone) large subunit